MVASAVNRSSTGWQSPSVNENKPVLGGLIVHRCASNHCRAVGATSRLLMVARCAEATDKTKDVTLGVGPRFDLR